MIRRRSLRRVFVPWCGVLIAALLGLWIPSARSGTTGEESSPGEVRYGIGQPMRIGPDERVDTVVTVGGDLAVLGEVEHDAVAVGGSIHVGPQGRIGEDAVAIGGVVVAQEGARIDGDRVELAGMIGSSLGRDDERALAGSLATSVTTFAQVLGAFVIALALLALMPRRIQVVREHLTARPGRCALTGLGLMLLFLPFLGALVISVIGIVLIPIAIMALAALLLVGMSALGLALGYALPFYPEHRSAMGALALGFLGIAIVALIPWVGAIVVPLASFYAAGAVILSRFGGTRPSRPETSELAPTRPSGPPAQPMPPPSAPPIGE